MKFNELQLEVAIHKTDARFDPLADEQRTELAKRVFATWVEIFGTSVFPFEIGEIAIAKRRMQKASSKLRAFEIAIEHNQWDCFWRNRGKGPCSDEVEAGHIVARSNGAGDLTIENAVIECSAHNNQRKAMTIEEYLSSPMTTD
jgi:hypothetical protein